MKQPPPQDSLLLTYEEVAATLRVERSTIYRWVRKADGFPQPVYPGRSPRFRREEIEAYIAKRAA